MGVRFVGPMVEGKKARVATVTEIIDRVLSSFVPGDLAGKRVLVIGGSSEEPIDRVRVITNTGTGETAVAIAQAAVGRGAMVELWAGRMSVTVPSGITVRTFRTVGDLLSMVEQVDHDAVIVPASLSDYTPIEAKGKIPSDEASLELKLRPLPKVLPALRSKTKVLVGFKAEVDLTEAKLVLKARARMSEYGLDMIVANDLGNVGEGRTKAVVITSNGKKRKFTGSKAELADLVLDGVVKALE
jgi:phosphopantothenoylcysteine decarboxylase/phosphopantothenate--cysteine ligase